MNGTPRFRGLASRMAARVMASRFAGPIARVALAAAALLFLALIGRVGLAGAFTSPALAAATTPAPPSAPVLGPAPALAPASALASASALAPASALASASALAPAPALASAPSRTPASSDDPVVLNTATVTDLRRLPGIGDKRANAILALRARLGRFRAVEDLLKVKGIGRAMLKRLRPLVRVDPGLAPGDAGAPAGAVAPSDEATWSPSALG